MLDSKIKILIVSRTPWNEENSFGNTFTNLFYGMKHVSIANICCQGGVMNSRIINESFQLTDKSIISSILGRIPGQIIKNGEKTSEAKKSNIPRKTIFYALRELIWFLGRWKSKKIKTYVQDFKPDILYLPIYRSHYMCEVEKFIIKLTGVPYAVHITDDVYGYLPQTSDLNNRLQRIIRRDIRQIMNGAAYGEVFSPLMAEEYGKVFKIPFYVIGKTVDRNRLPNIHIKTQNNNIRFVYTGNYGGERGNQLLHLAQSINKIFSEGRAILEIYSTTQGDSNVVEKLLGIACVRLMGAVAPDRILEIQQSADYLIHVEGFSPRAVCEARLSFSTKIIDYLVAGRPIIAIGSQDITSIQVLKMHDMAFVATNYSELDNLLIDISQGHIDDGVKVNNGRDYLINHCNSTAMKPVMYQRFTQLLKQ